MGVTFTSSSPASATSTSTIRLADFGSFSIAGFHPDQDSWDAMDVSVEFSLELEGVCYPKNVHELLITSKNITE